MPAPKLTSELKQQILSLYCETDASTIELASQFGVSSSTVLRLLQGSLSTEEYQRSVKQKQSKSKRSPSQRSERSDSEFLAPTLADLQSNSPVDLLLNHAPNHLEDHLEDHLVDQVKERRKVKPESKVENILKNPKESVKGKKDLKKIIPLTPTSSLTQTNQLSAKQSENRQLELSQLDLMAPFLSSSSSSNTNNQIFAAFAPPLSNQEESLQEEYITNDSERYSDQPSQVVPEDIQIRAIAPQFVVKDPTKILNKKVIKPRETLAESPRIGHIETRIEAPREKFSEEEAIIDEVSDEFSDDDEFDRLEDDLDDEIDEADDGEEIESFTGSRNDGLEVQIYSLEDADFPSTCYMVVDKSSDMITRPLKEFSEIGKISADDEGRSTLLIFSNHRVAKRFSRQNQRIIKFSGELLYITQEKLAAKGITRLLFEGRVYAL
jgi:transposase-like protein